MSTLILENNEEILGDYDGGNIILTSHRIRQLAGGEEEGVLSSILLENVSGVQLSESKYIGLLYVGLASCIYALSFADMQDNSTLYAAGVSILFIILYFAYRPNHLSITSKGSATLSIQVNNFDKSELIDLIDKLESAQLKLYKYK